jgi:hypothetical protein
MGVHRITSELARYYALRERVLGSGITLLGLASEKLDKLDKAQLEKLGDLAYLLLPHAPGYAGKLIPVIARLFWKLADAEEKSFDLLEPEELEKMIEDLKAEIEKV